MIDKEREAANDQGFDEPFETDPVNSPDEWEYRGLNNTGGYIMSRIWRHKTKNLEILYNLKDSRVTMIGAKYDEDEERYIGDTEDVVAKREGSSVDDSELQQVTLILMEQYA